MIKSCFGLALLATAHALHLEGGSTQEDTPHLLGHTTPSAETLAQVSDEVDTVQISTGID